MKKTLVKLLVAGACSAVFSISAFAAGWEQSGNSWYYTDENGARLKGWQNIKEQNRDKTHWYYFDEETGEMATGWKEIKEESRDVKHYYYFDEKNGAMWVNTETPDGYSVNEDGVYEEKKADDNSTAADTDKNAEADTAEQSSQGSSEKAASQSGISKEKADKLVSLINEKRKAAGLSEFVEDEKLRAGAEIRAEELTEAYSSARPDKSKAKTAIKDWESYAALVEIKDKASSAEETVLDWYEEDSSEKLILSDSFSQDGKTFSFTNIGAGCYEKDGELYYAVFLSGYAND